MLGWLNCRVMVISDLPSFSLDELLEEVASTLGAALSARSAEIAHLKISGRSGSYLGLVNLVDRRQPGELSIPSGGQVHDAELTINARVARADEDSQVSALGVDLPSGGPFPVCGTGQRTRNVHMVNEV